MSLIYFNRKLEFNYHLVIGTPVSQIASTDFSLSLNYL